MTTYTRCRTRGKLFICCFPPSPPICIVLPNCGGNKPNIAQAHYVYKICKRQARAREPDNVMYRINRVSSVSDYCSGDGTHAKVMTTTTDLSIYCFFIIL